MQAGDNPPCDMSEVEQVISQTVQVVWHKNWTIAIAQVCLLVFGAWSAPVFVPIRLVVLSIRARDQVSQALVVIASPRPLVIIWRFTKGFIRLICRL